MRSVLRIMVALLLSAVPGPARMAAAKPAQPSGSGKSFMSGGVDINVAPSTARRIHKAIPGSRWEVFEQSGHLPYFEEPDRFVRTVEGFLGAP